MDSKFSKDSSGILAEPKPITIHMDDNVTPRENKKNQSNGNFAVEAVTPDSHWRSCCLEVDRQMVVYFGQLAFSFAVLGFSGAMLYRANGSCEQSSPYIGLVSFLLGKLLSSVTDSTRR